MTPEPAPTFAEMAEAVRAEASDYPSGPHAQKDCLRATAALLHRLAALSDEDMYAAIAAQEAAQNAPLSERRDAMRAAFLAFLSIPTRKDSTELSDGINLSDWTPREGK